MKPEWVDPYENSTFKERFLYDHDDFKRRGDVFYLNLPSMISCSFNLKTALEFAFNEIKPDHCHVLFVITLHNFKVYAGFRLNNPAYSSYPSESELLMMEGLEVYVL